MDKRVKKLPLMALSMTMAESFKELDTDSSLGKALEMSCFIQSMLARILAEFEMALERDVLQPLNKLSEAKATPTILYLNQVAKNSGNITGVGAGPAASGAALKLENLKEEEEEMKRRVEQSKDEYMADLYHFSTKEDSYANYFIKLLEIQAEYHRKSLGSLDATLAELKETHCQPDPGVAKVYGMPLEAHLKASGREIALPIEACVMMLLTSGMREEGLFRLAAGASVLRKLKYGLDSGSSIPDEFYADPHAVAGRYFKKFKAGMNRLYVAYSHTGLSLTIKAIQSSKERGERKECIKEPETRLEYLRDICSHLPKHNYNNMRYLIRFLAKLAEQQEVNKMTPSNIAIVLGPNLLWPQETEGKNLDVSPGPPPKATQLSTETAISLSIPVPVDEALRKTKRVAPSRPTVPPPPLVQPRTPPPVPLQSLPPAPESPSIPKALPRRTLGGSMRAPSVPPPLPPQPAKRPSRRAVPSPKLPPELTNSEAAEAKEPPPDETSTETSKDSTTVATEPDEPSNVGSSSSPPPPDALG
ncbi:hypothetical protein JD844_028381 [Phrynosoma platyrhinos]|uniref:Rho-GAP domain-containing protein n=1 Tax=Phrynosoma platyrhinos TaxID=52577 RepID=A0ABQ7SHW8_PHRPL|nr:hypothetical protein JD844_028381 [Phrynosoma platyrhinos]